MLFQDAPPDTSAYMIAGYTIFFVVSAIYLLSLAIRRRNLEQDLKTLESIQAESRQAPARAAGASSSRSTGRSRPAAAQRRQVRKKVIRRK